MTIDAHNRSISYLRISVTDRCNLRCIYCMPPERRQWRPVAENLQNAEIETIVRAAVELGISKVRLTGGEPLLRKDLVDLVHRLADIPGIDDLAMTTNGVLLTRYAVPLAAAGLKRVNVSLDTLRPERFRHITRLGHLEDALAGIAAAQQAGLEPIKINTVVIRGVNDDEVLDFARQTRAGWHVRFIEVMPLGDHGLASQKFQERIVTAQEMQHQIEAALGKLEPAKMGIGYGPARYYRLAGARGTIGFITPISEHFCYQCNRIRLTADGQLRLCLLSDDEIDLRTPLRQGAGIPDIKALISSGIVHKPPQHYLTELELPRKRLMAEIGG